jgi:hypothetical protein
MNQSQELAEVKRKIAKLCQFTTANGCSEGEALNYAEKLGKLLSTYDLTLDQVLLDDQQCELINIGEETGKCDAMLYCMVPIARYCQCKMWTSKNRHIVNGRLKRSSRYQFFGLPADLEMAKYLYDVIRQSIDAEVARYKETADYRELNKHYHAIRLTNSFKAGMSSRLAYRLNELAEDRNKETGAKNIATPTGETSIVLVKQNKIEDEFMKLHIKLKNSNNYQRRPNEYAAAAGRAAGSHVNLNRPVGDSLQKLLT